MKFDAHTLIWRCCISTKGIAILIRNHCTELDRLWHVVKHFPIQFHVLIWIDWLCLVISSKGIPILKIRRSHDRVTFIMEIPILKWRRLYIESTPFVAVDLPLRPVIPSDSQATLAQLLLATTWGYLVSQATNSLQVRCILLNKNFIILIQISLKFVPEGPNDIK